MKKLFNSPFSIYIIYTHIYLLFYMAIFFTLTHTLDILSLLLLVSCFYAFFFFPFDGTSVWIQGFLLPKKVFYHLSHISSLSWVFLPRVLLKNRRIVNRYTFMSYIKINKWAQRSHVAVKHGLPEYILVHKLPSK